MKIKEYNEMMRYLTRPKEPTTKESKGAYDKFVAEGKNGYAPKKVKFEDTAIGKHVENTLYMYGETDKKPKHYDSELKKAQQTINKVIDYSPKKTKRPEAIIKTTKPKQLEFNFQELFNNLDSITKAYEPVPTPPAVAPRDKDLDKGIASILNVRVRNA
jgi:hypothetical protein